MPSAKYLRLLLPIALLLFCEACAQPQKAQPDKTVVVGAERLNEYVPILQNQKVALLVNHTSIVSGKHLLDTLIASGIEVTKVFAPEHGFRGNMANGEHVKDDRDLRTGLPIISLYGKNKKPSLEQMQDVDIVVYDIQDVGARFYTYISAMHYMMEACAESSTDFIILDRPNPNGHYVDGPILDLAYKSYVGMHPIPIVYGMTAGELAQMILGEGWLNTISKLNLEVVEIKNWDHKTVYNLPVKPSPNLPNFQSVALYPSLCLFEGTNVSVGRGTDFPFQVLGTPDNTYGEYQFTPRSIPGASKYPKHENLKCYGFDLRNETAHSKIDLSYLIAFYQSSTDPENFFNSFFNKLAGTSALRQQIEEGKTEEEIRATWQDELRDFNRKRKKYLLYSD